MGIQQIKDILHHRIEEVDDRFLRVIYAMIETYLSEQEEDKLKNDLDKTEANSDWKQLREDQLMDRLNESIAQYKRGEVVTLEEFKKKDKK